MIVTFQDGKLAGYDLAVVSEEWDNINKKIKLKPHTDETTLEIPSVSNTCAPGDTFILTNLRLPQEYIDKAEQQLLEEAQAYLNDYCEKRVQLRCKCDDVLFCQQEIYMRPGQMVRIKYDPLELDREIRCTSIKKYIENNDQRSYRYELTLSDFLQGNTFKDWVEDVKKYPDEIKQEGARAKAYAQRNYRDVMKLYDNLYDPEGDYFEKALRPLAVETLQLIVGAPSLQFKYVDSKGNAVVPTMVYRTTDKTFYAAKGTIRHLKLDMPDEITNDANKDYWEWDIKNDLTKGDLDPQKYYYLYARCSKNKASREATYILSDTQIAMDKESGYYHLWIGFLNSLRNGDRSFRTLYGFTEIVGGNITTNKIISAEGNSYIHLDENKIHIGDKANYMDYQDSKMTLKGAFIQSKSGDESEIGAFIGEWVSTRIYYPGDEVTYLGSTYRCRIEHGNKAPNSNPSHWYVIAQGGKRTEYRYTSNTSATSAPSISTASREPSGWSLTPPTLSSGRYCWVSQATIKADNTLEGYWSYPVRFSGEKGDTGATGSTGAPGATGPTGPALNFRGNWDINKVYVYTNVRRDIVYYKANKTYYIRAKTFGNTNSTTSITNTNFWESFGGSFESVATGLLFAEKALISGWNFNDSYIWSPDNRCYLDGYGRSKGTPIIALGNDAVTVGANDTVTVNKKLL